MFFPDLESNIHLSFLWILLSISVFLISVSGASFWSIRNQWNLKIIISRRGCIPEWKYLINVGLIHTHPYFSRFGTFLVWEKSEREKSRSLSFSPQSPLPFSHLPFPFDACHNSFFGIRDFPYLKLGIRYFKAKSGRDSGLKVCGEGGMPKLTLGFTGLQEAFGWDYGIAEPYWGAMSKRHCTA